jgi:hypothetical protein
MNICQNIKQPQIELHEKKKRYGLQFFLNYWSTFTKFISSISVDGSITIYKIDFHSWS